MTEKNVNETVGCFSWSEMHRNERSTRRLQSDKGGLGALNVNTCLCKVVALLSPKQRCTEPLAAHNMRILPPPDNKNVFWLDQEEARKTCAT